MGSEFSRVSDWTRGAGLSSEEWIRMRGGECILARVAFSISTYFVRNETSPLIETYAIRVLMYNEMWTTRRPFAPDHSNIRYLWLGGEIAGGTCRGLPSVAVRVCRRFTTAAAASATACAGARAYTAGCCWSASSRSPCTRARSPGTDRTWNRDVGQKTVAKQRPSVTVPRLVPPGRLDPLCTGCPFWKRVLSRC